MLELLATLVIAQASTADPYAVVRKDLQLQGVLGRKSLCGLTRLERLTDLEMGGLNATKIISRTSALGISSSGVKASSEMTGRMHPKLAVFCSKTSAGPVVSLSVFQNARVEACPEREIYLQTYRLSISTPVAPLEKELDLLLDQFEADYKAENPNAQPLPPSYDKSI